MKILKVLVLLLSIAGGSLVVWNATRDKGTATDNKEASANPDDSFASPESDSKELQFSSKSAGIMVSDDIAEIVEDESAKIIITDHQVKMTRESMLSTSKSGLVMSDDKIREMLEQWAKEKAKAEAQPTPEQESSSKEK